jgi:hypothetical protein
VSGVSTIETDLRFSGREDFWIIVEATKARRPKTPVFQGVSKRLSRSERARVRIRMCGVCADRAGPAVPNVAAVRQLRTRDTDRERVAPRDRSASALRSERIRPRSDLYRVRSRIVGRPKCGGPRRLRDPNRQTTDLARCCDAKP